MVQEQTPQSVQGKAPTTAVQQSTTSKQATQPTQPAQGDVYTPKGASMEEKFPLLKKWWFWLVLTLILSAVGIGLYYWLIG